MGNTKNLKPVHIQPYKPKKQIPSGAKSRASFTWQVKKDVLCIIDTDEGMSVTNDIENVLNDISRASGPGVLTLPIIYQDTDFNWDGVDPIIKYNEVVNVKFIGLGESNMLDAIDKIKEYYENNSSF